MKSEDGMSFVSQIRNTAKTPPALMTKGAKILALAEAVRPYLSAHYAGCRTAEGIPVQPSQIHALAINLAEVYVNHKAAQGGLA
jgi:hypothetical protein